MFMLSNGLHVLGLEKVCNFLPNISLCANFPFFLAVMQMYHYSEVICKRQRKIYRIKLFSEEDCAETVSLTGSGG